MQTDYHYRAQLNVYKRNSYLQWLPVLVIPMIAGGRVFGPNGFIAILLLILIALIWIMIRVDVDRNVLLFQDEHIMYLKNPDALPLIYCYSDINTLHVEHPHRGSHYTRLTLINGTKFNVEIDRQGGLDAKRNDFFAFLWTKNSSIVITSYEGFFHYKYFMLQGQVQRLEV